MSDHSIVIDLQFPGSPRFECNAPDGAPCKAQWDCECETIWTYRTVNGVPMHDSTPEGTDASGCEVHAGRFNNDQCNLTEWHDNQDEAVEGTVRIDVTPVNEIDYVTFTATSARIEKDS